MEEMVPGRLLKTLRLTVTVWFLYQFLAALIEVLH